MFEKTHSTLVLEQSSSPSAELTLASEPWGEAVAAEAPADHSPASPEAIPPPEPGEPARPAAAPTPPSEPAELVEAIRGEVRRQCEAHGYITAAAWRRLVERLAAQGAGPELTEGLGAELARAAGEGGWVFPGEAPPADTSRATRTAALVEKARRQVEHHAAITAGYVSALLALAGAWGVAEEELVGALVERSVAEHWSASFSPACGLGGLLAAERAKRRPEAAREELLVDVERRGRKGWISWSDQADMFAALRGQGLAADAAQRLIAELRPLADERGWAFARPGEVGRLDPERLGVLVEKAARQAARAGRLSAGFRQALLSEARADGIGRAALTAAIAERRARERWGTTFDRGWRLRARGSRRAWAQLVQGPPVLVLTLLIVAFAVSRLGLTPPARGKGAAAPTPTAAAAPAEPTPEPAPTPTPSEWLVVANTDRLGVRLRAEPKSGRVLGGLAEGKELEVVGPDAEVGGETWKRVRAPDGTEGWVHSGFVRPLTR